MKKIMIAWILVIIGSIPLAFIGIVRIFDALEIPLKITLQDAETVKFLNEYAVGIVFGSFFIGLVLITAGLMIIRKDKSFKQAMKDENDLHDGEYIVHKQKGDLSIITVTNKRVRFYGVYTKNLKYSAVDLPQKDRIDYPLSEISKVIPVNYCDVASNSLARKNKREFGIQLQLKNGYVVNLPINEQNIVAGQISGLLNRWQEL